MKNTGHIFALKEFLTICCIRSFNRTVFIETSLCVDLLNFCFLLQILVIVTAADPCIIQPVVVHNTRLWEWQLTLKQYQHTNRMQIYYLVM